MPDLGDQIEKAQGDRTKLIAAIESIMDKEVTDAQRDLLAVVVTEFVDKLDTDEDGNIKNTLANKRLFNRLDNVFTMFNGTVGLDIAAVMIKQVDKILNFNNRYFGLMASPTVMGNIYPETKTAVYDWLGISQKGGLVVNGYLDRIVTDDTIRNNIRDTMFQAIATNKGYQQVKNDLREYLIGKDKKDIGAMLKYYRGFVYDTFSQTDRTQSKMLANKLKLDYAIYEGGTIKTTRPFCRARNGKVFTSDEIAAFNPPTGKPPNYNPFTDGAGYNCRHHYNWINFTLAVILRPDLKEKATTE